MNRTYAIVDDFLSPQEHRDLWDGFEQRDACAAAARGWNRVYQLTGGENVMGSMSTGSVSSLRDATVGGEPCPPALRPLSEKLNAVMSGSRPPVSLDPWTGFTMSAWVYRRGAGLEWHSDRGWLAGYIYYAHPLWHSSWGGELLVGTDSASGRSGSDVDAACRIGGVFVHPSPNRLVLVRGGTWHCIKKVENAAGDAFRASVSGFFFNTESQASGQQPVRNPERIPGARR